MLFGGPATFAKTFASEANIFDAAASFEEHSHLSEFRMAMLICPL